MTFWTGRVNEPYAFEAEIGFYDTTLRDGEQTVGVVLSPEDKLELARGLDELGIERIEAGFPRVSKDDWRAVELIRDAGLKAEVWGFSRAVDADGPGLLRDRLQDGDRSGRAGGGRRRHHRDRESRSGRRPRRSHEGMARPSGAG